MPRTADFDDVRGGESMSGFWYRGIHGKKKAVLWCFQIAGCVHQVRELARVWEIIDEEVVS